MNKKGMTLIEMVAALLILSIASLTLFGGFSAVIRIIGNSGTIKNNSDMLLAYAEGKSQDELDNKIEKVNKPLEYTISSSTGNTIQVKRSIDILNVKDNDNVHLKNLQKPVGEQKVKDTEMYKEFDLDIKNNFYPSLINKQKEYVDAYGNYSTLNAMLKSFYTDIQNQWIEFPKQLLPKEYFNQQAGRALYVIPYYPWEIMISSNDFSHGTLIIFLNELQGDVNSLSGSEYIHIVYDYLNNKWYYCSKNNYRLTYADSTSNGKTLYDVEHNGFIKKWSDFSDIIKNPKNGWKVLDIEAEFSDVNSDSFWKDVN